MKPMRRRWAAACAALTVCCAAHAQDEQLSFAVISHPVSRPGDISALRAALQTTDADNLAFVVVNGIKAVDEGCTEQLYQDRQALLAEAKNGLVVSLAAEDWADCRNEKSKSAAIGRLNRLRELFFFDDFSLGGSRIPVVRQSTDPRYRSYSENARWEIGDTMFASINLPGSNNHYLFEAGRNSEFEDRLIANRDWLHRIFNNARWKKLNSVVLFADGNPLTARRGIKRDGYAETRRELLAAAARFSGKVLLVHCDKDRPTSTTIRWRGNIAEVNAGSGLLKLTVVPGNPLKFKLEKP